MKRALALAIVFATAYVVRQARADAIFEPRTLALAAGFALVAAALAGDAAERVRLPRVSGYLLFGVITGPAVANVISGSMARDLRLIDGVAVTLIALMAGLELDFADLRPRLGSVLRFGGTIIVTLWLALFAVLYAAWGYLPIAPDAGPALKVAIVALFATIVTSFSPTVTIAVIAEERAAGPLTDLTMAVVVLGDLALVLFFGLAMQFVRTAGGGTAEVGLFANLAWDVFGSVAFGSIVGAVFALYLRFIGRELVIVLIAACAVLSEIGGYFRFEPVLAGLSAGLIVRNVAPVPGHELRDAVERGALPILIVFFAGAGASLAVDSLSVTGPLAAGIAGLRLACIRIGVETGGRFANVEPALRRLVWRGLVSQAGLTLGLTVIVGTEFPGWGAVLQTLMLAMIALHEVAGPILFRSALAQAGELGRAAAPPSSAPAAGALPPA